MPLRTSAWRRLDFLQRITVDTGAKTLPHDRVKIDEHAAAQQLIDFVLARRVRAHQLLDRCVLVGAVMVDMHAGIGGEPRVHEIDELLEYSPLAVAVVRPHRLVLPVTAVAKQYSEQEMQTARRFPERITFDIKNDVGLGRARQ
jgi:hypothetical protein